MINPIQTLIHTLSTQTSSITDKDSYLTRFRNRFEFGDALFFFYFIVVIRQWFWSFNNTTAWVSTIPLALVSWTLYILTKEEREKTDRWFWIIVGIPLLFAYAIRFPFPDTSFDVWGLRLFHGERALRGFLYLPGEFFPTAAPFNPTPDMITGIFRHLLGYRLGTIVNLVALLWAAAIVSRMLRPLVDNSKTRAACVLLVVFIEHLLFEINNYMPDLLALPVLLEATLLTLGPVIKIERRRVVHVALLIGFAVTLKLSNGALAMPLVLIWLWRLISTKPFDLRQFAGTALLSLAVTIPLLLHFSVWVYRLTGSPIFPLYNGVFHSPLYPPFNGWDSRWGGYGVVEILGWPVLMFFEPVRTAELPVYSGRLSVAFIVAILCLLLARRLDSGTRQLALTLVCATLLWSVTMGYIRYGLLLEVLSGVLLIKVAAQALKSKWPRTASVPVALMITILLIAQSTLAATYLLRREWSMRPTIFDDFSSYSKQLRHVLRDYSIRSMFEPNELARFDRVEVWVVSGAKTSGPMILVNDRAPFLGVRSGGLFLAQANREAFARDLAAFGGRSLSSLVLREDFGESVYSLRHVGLGVGRVENVIIPFYSKNDNPVQASFIEVTRDYIDKPVPKRTPADGPLPINDFRAELKANLPSTSQPGEFLDLYVRVKNDSSSMWPSQASIEGKHRISLTGRWRRSEETVGDLKIVSLPYDLLPGESVVVLVQIRAPTVRGLYSLEFDLMQDGVGKFSERGSSGALNAAMRVGQ